MAPANYVRAFKEQEHNRDMEDLKRSQMDLSIKYTTYTCIISLHGIFSILDTGDVKISELQTNQAKEEFLN